MRKYSILVFIFIGATINTYITALYLKNTHADLIKPMLTDLLSKRKAAKHFEVVVNLTVNQ